MSHRRTMIVLGIVFALVWGGLRPRCAPIAYRKPLTALVPNDQGAVVWNETEQ